ncbi:MAG: regulator of protease activity HflC (stomatin/prohibitin superfamily) [Candidatus Deianiraeaceae bacterium]|jgi:regulator of protease activity HflC (stomatin/prohibitin superfamily)
MNNNNPFGSSANVELKAMHIIALAILVFIAVGVFASFKVIDTRERGIVKIMGKIKETPLLPGVNFAIPFVSQIRAVDVTNTRYSMNNIKIYTKDQQRATLDIVANYHINPLNVVKLYKDLGFLDKTSVELTLMLPVLKSTITNQLGQWTAAEVISNKEKIAQDILSMLQKEVAKKELIDFINFEIVNIDLDNDYERAVREKVVAEQKAQKSLNDTKRIQEETRQRLISAEGEAKAMKIKAQALSKNSNLIDYEKVQVSRERVQKWDGRLPTTMLSNSSDVLLNMK